MANVTVTPEALEQLTRLPRVIRERIGKLFQRLEAWPAVSGAKSASPATWPAGVACSPLNRVRFRVQGETVVVDKIGHRSEFYED